jgi:hypothetical protein
MRSSEVGIAIGVAPVGGLVVGEGVISLTTGDCLELALVLLVESVC